MDTIRLQTYRTAQGCTVTSWLDGNVEHVILSTKCLHNDASKDNLAKDRDKESEGT
jgi:hypothetical protein